MYEKSVYFRVSALLPQLQASFSSWTHRNETCAAYIRKWDTDERKVNHSRVEMQKHTRSHKHQEREYVWDLNNIMWQHQLVWVRFYFSIFWQDNKMLDRIFGLNKPLVFPLRWIRWGGRASKTILSDATNKSAYNALVFICCSKETGKNVLTGQASVTRSVSEDKT